VARLARILAIGVPHHVTQRGNARRFILDCDADRIVYLNLLRQNIELHGVALIGYCLMSNHVHLVVIPHDGCGLALALKDNTGATLSTGTRFIARAVMRGKDATFPVHWTARICGKRCGMRS
jgi:REP element-mobilizing transposase RayT